MAPPLTVEHEDEQEHDTSSAFFLRSLRSFAAIEHLPYQLTRTPPVTAFEL